MYTRISRRHYFLIAANCDNNASYVSMETAQVNMHDFVFGALEVTSAMTAVQISLPSGIAHEARSAVGMKSMFSHTLMRG